MTDKEYFECTVIDDLGSAFYRVADATVSIEKIIEYKDIYEKYVDYYSNNNGFCEEREFLRYNDLNIDAIYRKYLVEVVLVSSSIDFKNITSDEVKELILEMEKAIDIIDKI